MPILSEMTGLERFRRRVPLIVFVLLLVMIVLVVGFACACFGDPPLKAAERTLSGSPAMPALVEMWAALVVILLAAPIAFSRRVAAIGRASPEVLKCFLR